MAGPEDLPSQKLSIDFGWMLNEVARYLSVVDCKQIALAEKLPQSLIEECTHSEGFSTTLVHTLETRGKYDPLNPDGLIEILKKVKRLDAVKVVTQYKSEQRYKDEKEQYKKMKKKEEKETAETAVIPKDMEDIEKQLAASKIKFLALINKEMKVMAMYEKKVRQYRKGKIEYAEVNQAYLKWSEVIEKGKHKLQTESSGSSISSNEGNNDTFVQKPIPETGKDSPLVQKRYKKTIPRERSNSLPTTHRIRITPTQPLQSESDNEDTTGDSGVSSGESERSAWIKHSSLRIAQKKKTVSPGDQSESAHYSPLLTTKFSHDDHVYAEPTTPTTPLRTTVKQSTAFVSELQDKLNRKRE